MKTLNILPVLISLSSAAQYGPPASVSQACQVLSAKLPGKVALNPASPQSHSSTSLDSLYNSTQATYWDKSNSLDVPACMVFPSSASDVSTTVQVLDVFPDIPFALKSGGHNWNRGFSSTDGGILISFRPNLQGISLSQDQNTVDVGPGARWKEVIGELDQHGRYTVGGRDDDVGVGGYIIFGGISYLTAQYGFASDGVVNFEVVLANGTIVSANATHNSDLYFSLRGGGNNFGIVTKFTLLTHPVGQVWGGRRVYTTDKTPQLISAIVNYTTNFNNSISKSAIIPDIIWANGSTVWTMSFFWDGPSPPDHVFAEFFSIEALSDTTMTQSYPMILDTGSSAAMSPGRTTNRVLPLANLPLQNMTEFLQWHFEQASNASFINDAKAGFTLFVMALQPIPVDLQRAKAVGSAGALSVDPDGGDKWWIEYSLAWTEESADARFIAELADLTDKAQERQKRQYAGIKPTKYRSGKLPDVAYSPVFANDAQTGQNVCRSYGRETFGRLVETRRRYDPGMFFQRRTSGFHLELP